MIVAFAWSAETRYEDEKGQKIGSNEMSMGPFGRIAALGKVLSRLRVTGAVTLFAAPEFLFRDTKNHFQTKSARDEIVVKLAELSKQVPDLVLFPGTLPWVEEVTAEECAKLYKSFLLAHKSRKYPTKSAEAMAIALAKRAEGEIGELTKRTKCLLARNTMYGFANGEIIVEYHKRCEALDQNLKSQDLVVSTIDATPVFFPPQESSNPVFQVGKLVVGAEICADHEYASLFSCTQDKSIDVHLVVSDEVYPVAEHACAKYMLHASRVIPGVHDTSKLPSIDEKNLEKATQAIKGAAVAQVHETSTPFGSVLLGLLPIGD
jgi:predicted amidohydrolase